MEGRLREIVLCTCAVKLFPKPEQCSKTGVWNKKFKAGNKLLTIGIFQESKLWYFWFLVFGFWFGHKSNEKLVR